MALFNTSSTVDTSILLKSKLDKNMVGTNWYIENLQYRRDLDWYSRYNVVDIEEELTKQVNYTQEKPLYTPIEATIRNVKSISGEETGSGWANIAFKDLKHPCHIGSRYRFSLEFPDMTKMTEEQKHYNTNIWIGVNKTPIHAGNQLVIRCCNTALAMKGKGENNISEIHYEPVILENELKYMQVYYNQANPVPQAEWYAIMQCNYFTNQIQINDRFLFGTIDKIHRPNNSAYKVKAVLKSTTTSTFIEVGNTEEELKKTNLVIIALDKDMLSPDDDLDTRLASNAPVYDMIFTTQDSEIEDEDESVPEEPGGDTPEEEETSGSTEENIEIIEKFIDIMLGESYSITLEEPYQTLSSSLENILEANWNKYYKLIISEDNKEITITNLKACTKGKLVVLIDSVRYIVSLKGFY